MFSFFNSTSKIENHSHLPQEIITLTLGAEEIKGITERFP